MEVGRQSTAGIGLNSAGAHGRGRGRARVRVQPHHETENAIRHTSSDSHYNSGKMHGHFEDSFKTSLVSVSDDTKLPKDNLVRSRYQSVDDKGQFSGKENSSASSDCSPKTQRSRRSHFDTGVMSRINNHLRQGMNERSDGGAAHSLDRKKEPPSSRLSRLGSPKLHLVIPAGKTVGVQDAAAPCRKMAGGGGRPRSVTHPLPSPPGSGLLLEGAKPSEPGHSMAVASSQPHQTAQSQTTVSNPSISSLARVKGRGRARGRARSRQQEMECSTFPGSAPGNGHDLDLQQTESHSQPEGLDRDRFADAQATVTDSPEHVESAPRSEKAQSSSAGTGHAPSPSAKELPTDGGARVASVDEGGRQTNKSDETSRTLTLKIDVDGRNTVAEGPEVCSPGLVDDITQLLSPDHEYTLDWAAAMETPTPDTSSDSAPVWNTSDLADDS